jgi:Transposase and inactivated derivatives
MQFDTDILIPEDDSVRLIDLVMEEINYQKLYQTYSPNGRNPVVEPKILCKIVVYAYSQGIFSSRKMESACRRDLTYMWLLQNEPAPDHNTIARFRKDHLQLCIEDLFTQFVRILAENSEIQWEDVFIDGTKIEANANKFSFVWRKSIEKSKSKLLEKTWKQYAEKFPDVKKAEDLSSEHLRSTINHCIQQAQEKEIVMVHGGGKRKTQEQKDIETLHEYTTRLETYESYQAIFGTRNSFSKTDTDATFMRLKEDIMKNGQLKAAYNIQAAISSEYIIDLSISSERNDVNTLIPFCESSKKKYGKSFTNLVADAGYESEENYLYLEQERITSYIKPMDYQYSKTRKYQKDKEYRLAMEYIQEDDVYLCKDRRKLTYRGTQTRKSRSGYEAEVKVYACESCQGCPYLGKCYKGKEHKKIEIREQFERCREQSRANIVSDKGIQLRMNRSIQVEGFFGVTKQDYGFRRFLTRGAPNVQTEYFLLAFGFNINKLHSRIQNKRLGLHLFELKAS